MISTIEQNRAFGRALRALAHAVDTKWADSPNGSPDQLAAMARRWMQGALADVGGPPVPEEHISGHELLKVEQDPRIAPWNQPEAQP